MKVSKYGVELSKLTEDKLELVREWRNDPKISQYMEFRGEISSEMQQKWFHKIDNDNNYYFLIEYKDKEVGLVNIKDIDYQKGEGEAGIFIYDDTLLNSTVSFQSMLCLYDFCFEELKLKKIIAHVLQDNKRAVQFNKMFGYIKQTGQDDVYNQLYILDRNDYLKSKDKLIKILD